MFDKFRTKGGMIIRINLPSLVSDDTIITRKLDRTLYKIMLVKYVLKYTKT